MKRGKGPTAAAIAVEDADEERNRAAVEVVRVLLSMWGTLPEPTRFDLHEVITEWKRADNRRRDALLVLHGRWKDAYQSQ